MLGVFSSIAHIWVWLATGGALIVACLIAAWYLPPFRQTFLAMAVGFTLTTFMYGKGTYDERKVCEAREKLAEAARVAEDEKQAKLAAKSADELQAEIDALAKKLKDADDAYEKLRKGTCPLTDGDLR